MAMPRRLWQSWEVEVLRRLYADTLTADIARAIGRETRGVAQKAHQLGLKKSRAFIQRTSRDRTSDPRHACHAHAFKPGHVPSNKGLRRPGWTSGDMARTQFKPGQRPWTTLPIGSFRVSPNGILEQKFSDAPGNHQARWRSYQRLVWEAAHGPVPPGHIVVFRDPRQRTVEPSEVTLDKLECITFRENMRRNTVHAKYPKELVRLVQLRGALARQINLRQREQQQA